MTYAKTRIYSALLAVASLGLAAPALATGVAAGTLIENTASATFTTGSGTQTVDSNTVVLQVDELLDVTVASQDSGAVPISTSGAVLTFEVTNIGNGPEAFDLTVNPALPGNDFDAVVTGIAIDQDGDGLYDPALDLLLTPGASTPVIAADAALTVFVLVDSPGGVPDADLSQVNLLAEAVTGFGAPGTVFAGAGVGGSDAVAGATGADADANGSLIAQVVAVALNKSASVSDPFGGSEALPGAVVTYTITANVSGSGSVDGLLVSDNIPAGTTYQAGSLSLDSAPLTDLADADAGEASAAAIAVDLGTVAAGSAYSIQFNVTID